MSLDKSLFDRLGGKDTYVKVHKIFYDKVFAHPWLKLYFIDHPQEVFENQQTDFMVQLTGGPRAYGGKTPKFAHQHMMISDELFDIRSRLLSDAIKEAGVPDTLRDIWIAADNTLRKAVVKTSEKDCVKSHENQKILNFPKPGT